MVKWKKDDIVYPWKQKNFPCLDFQKPALKEGVFAGGLLIGEILKMTKI